MGTTIYAACYARDDQHRLALPLESAATEGHNIQMSSLDATDSPGAQVPKIYRAMKGDPGDGLPVVGSSNSSQLGVRPVVDVDVDAAGNVVPGTGGMSVAPHWRKLELNRIPKRLRHIVPGARGANSTFCYKLGEGPFQNGVVANGLELIPDPGPEPARHGVVAPVEAVPFREYQANLEMTRADWRVDEE